MPARRNRHVPADEKGQTAEHLLLAQVRLAIQQLADASREGLVVGHGAIVASENG